MGYPAFVANPDGPALKVLIFESADLPDHWSRLDEFEGAEYQRVVVPVETPEGRLDASIYASQP